MLEMGGAGAAATADNLRTSSYPARSQTTHLFGCEIIDRIAIIVEAGHASIGLEPDGETDNLMQVMQVRQVFIQAATTVDADDVDIQGRQSCSGFCGAEAHHGLLTTIEAEGGDDGQGTDGAGSLDCCSGFSQIELGLNDEQINASFAKDFCLFSVGGEGFFGS